MTNVHMRGQSVTADAARKPAPVERHDLLKVGAAWHKEGLRRFGAKSAYLASASREHEALKLSLDSLETMRQTPDPRMTTAAHFDAVNNKAGEMLKQMGARQDRALNIGVNEALRLRREIDERTRLHETGHGAEIRARLSAMAEGERRAVVSDAIESNQADIVAAVVKAPAMLSGLSKDELDGYKRQYEDKHAGELVQVLDAVNQSNERLVEAYAQAGEWLKRVQNHDHESDARKAQAVADAAGFHMDNGDV